ncbi:diadenylate cyclase CdaA [Chlamydia sp. 17-3921]|uniref:diadenylate cyclase CdaA n=1 Tax=Chlamydia sp. 17-3921 TaxID=2675798 RepID=UPI00191B195D|nr:diadenylate cyclase CdaA [Chlamydia sp. 17-3921]
MPQDITLYTTPLLEVLLIWAVLNYLLKFFWGTRAMDVVFGLLAFLFLFALADKFNLPIIRRLMLHVVNISAIVIFIIFQPEIRLALSRIRFRGRRFAIDTQDQFVEHLTSSIYHLSERQIGALVVLEKQDLFDEYLSFSSVKINADFSEELLETIFDPSSPLHDGAVILRGETIAYARVVLPLAHDTIQLSRSMGTRHRAALGASQRSDALIITVSEENGNVSLSRDGLLTRGVKIDKFKAVLCSILSPKKPKYKSFISRIWKR